PKAPPPQTVTLSPLPQTVTVVPAPPPKEEGGGGAGGPGPGGPGPGNPGLPGLPGLPGQAPSANHGGGTVTVPSYSGGGRVVSVGGPRPLDPAPKPPPPAPSPPDAFSGIAPDADIIR